MMPLNDNGFATVLYLRLIYFPFTPLNFGMGLTKVRFRDYFIGTGLGIIVGTFIFTFFVGTLREVWAGRELGSVAFFQRFLFRGALCLFLFYPKNYQKVQEGKLKRRHNRRPYCCSFNVWPLSPFSPYFRITRSLYLPIFLFLFFSPLPHPPFPHPSFYDR